MRIANPCQADFRALPAWYDIKLNVGPLSCLLCSHLCLLRFHYLLWTSLPHLLPCCRMVVRNKPRPPTPRIFRYVIFTLFSFKPCVCVWNRDPNSNGTPLPWSYPHNLHNSKWPQVCVVLEPIAGHGLPIHTCRIAKKRSPAPKKECSDTSKVTFLSIQMAPKNGYNKFPRVGSTPQAVKTSGIPT